MKFFQSSHFSHSLTCLLITLNHFIQTVAFCFVYCIKYSISITEWHISMLSVLIYIFAGTIYFVI